MTDSSGSILIADDDQNVVRWVGKYLTREGFSVTTCGDGAEAISLLESRPFDVLVTDIRMPKVNGLAVVDWVRSNLPGIRVIVITAFGSPSIKQLAVRKGAILYLEKPVDPILLVEVLRSVETDAGFSGRVEEIDILDYAQVILLTAKQAVLEVLSGDGTKGLLFFDNGKIVHARHGDTEGEAAVYACLNIRGGSFSNLKWYEPERISIDKPGDSLLIEAARLRYDDPAE